PSLARHHASAAADEYRRLLDWGMRLVFLLAVPAALALALLAVPLTATLFMHGEFAAHDVLMTRQAVIAYSVGLLGIILVKILAPGFYARQDIRTPVRFALVTLGATQLMNLAFVFPLKHAGLALAIALGGCLNAALLYRGLRRAGIYRPEPGWGRCIARLVLALAVMTAALLWSANSADWWLTARPGERAMRLAGVIALGAAAYLLVLAVLGFRLRDF